MKSKKSFEEFINSIKITNIKPSYYYTNYQRVAEHLETFKEIINKFNTINSKNDFVAQFSKIIDENKNAITITPLFTGVRPDKLVVLNDNGDYVEKFNHNTVSKEDAINFLDEVGFLERIDENVPFDLKSYFFGVNVGLDSNGRKNRSGRQMEILVGTYLKATNYDFIEQATIEYLNEKWNVEFQTFWKKKKTFDFIFKKNDIFYLVETNFFNFSGSKTDINTRFIKLKNDLEKISNKLKLVIITDGQGLLKAKGEIEDVFNQVEHVYNIDDLQNEVLKLL